MAHFDDLTPRAWTVSALCRAVADTLDAQFNPVTVRGEISGFSRAASGHCYFSIKDDTGQIRCAMFRRAASLVNFSPRDGELVEVRGRLSVYEARGDLQLVVESMERAGQGALFEQFLRLKAKLEAEGLFDPVHKRPLPGQPRAIGVVTSLGAAAWHDVVTALQRRVPHIPVLMAPALVQGNGAAATLVQALQNMYALTAEDNPMSAPVDVILLVRGGGSMEDLWAFNDETLARVMAQSPVPIICGVGHEIDFTIADFVADVRAPTPTAAAEMAAPDRGVGLQSLSVLEHRLSRGLLRQQDRQAQRLDGLATRLGHGLQRQHDRQSQQLGSLGARWGVGLQRQQERQAQRLSTITARLSRPQALLGQHSQWLDRLAHRLQAGAQSGLGNSRHQLERLNDRLGFSQGQVAQRSQRLELAALRLSSVDPHRVLERGYAWLSDENGQALTQVAQFQPGQNVRATLADGDVPLTVRSNR
ncbi:exodeoxyribonuclease VII large subunit [Limnohabitans planktonicus]|uniref:Exodeoxyribonuclease 7 large subunit n=1 Tax=Limnohabitans planktonicus II-D5 TaxID=1293045 RepID=A0A2T7UAQ5_9BURK|nr:exodeoxyribonuclease VII large subunit [Limnohabitans planktonicus]PVE41749.1 exodeoxyribonuclease VII large subunit [Limnohabitans planktonicus II-D5]|eukprot:gene6552-6408_t